MLNISGYIDGFDQNIEDTQNDISILSSGHYKLLRLKRFETSRPTGRKDFQLLYVAGGIADFWIGEEVYSLSTGSFVLYYPGERQYYTYELQKNTDVYWIHFTGIRVSDILEKYGLFGKHVFNAGTLSGYKDIFEKIILELQLRRSDFTMLVQLYFEELLLLISRGIADDKIEYNNHSMVYDAIEYFHKEYRSKLSIQDYANKINISSCWFIRSFKNHTGVTPVQYITEIRINKAKDLLKNGTFNISEVSSLVGCENPLYFSRMFKKHVGISPREYIRQGN